MFVLSVRQITVYKVTKLLGLDILLAMVLSEYCVEQFKGLSCCVPWGSLSIHLLYRACFFFFSALICAVVWQVNGVQHQTQLCDLQPDFI